MARRRNDDGRAPDESEAHRGTIGLVILDMGMPVMGGAECFRRLRELRKVPILIAARYAIDAEVQAVRDPTSRRAIESGRRHAIDVVHTRCLC